MKKIKVPVRYRTLMEHWIEDLRENGHLQGKDYLYDAHKDRYCCLGRLCKVAGTDPYYFKYHEMIFRGMADVPDIFISVNEEGHNIPIPPEENVANLIAAMNDATTEVTGYNTWGIPKQHSYTFDDIANFLEERIEYYEEEKD